MEAFEVLVIILSVVLTIFLIVGIVLMIVLIRISKQIRRVSDKAEHLVGNVESAAAAFRGAAGSFAVGKLVNNLFGIITKEKKGRKNGKR